MSNVLDKSAMSGTGDSTASASRSVRLRLASDPPPAPRAAQASRVGRLRRRARVALVRWMVRRPWLLALYYLWNGAYQWEQRASFFGRFRHLMEIDDSEGATLRYGLRRGIHRIEKGLIMRPRRSIFGEDYIQSAVSNYGRLLEFPCGRADDPLMGWAGDVLDQYFHVTGSSPVIDKARNAYSLALLKRKQPRGERVPFQRSQSPLQITLDDMLELAKRRRSVRWYLQKPVPRELIDRAIDVARWSPSACNRQPFEFRIYDDPALVARVAEIPMGTKNFWQNFPCVVVMVGQLRAFPEHRDRHVPYIDASLAAMSFQFALEVQGIGSCSINWPEIADREQRMAQALGLEPDERPVMLISLGYPDPEGLVPFSEKKSLDEIRSYNRAAPPQADRARPGDAIAQ